MTTTNRYARPGVILGLIVALAVAAGCSGGADDDVIGDVCAPELQPDILDIIRGLVGDSDFVADCPAIRSDGGTVIIGDSPSNGIVCVVLGRSPTEGQGLSGTLHCTVSVGTMPGEYTLQVGVYLYSEVGMPIYSDYLIRVIDCDPGTGCPDWERCDDGSDNDGDQMVDCQDMDCADQCAG